MNRLDWRIYSADDRPTGTLAECEWCGMTYTYDDGTTLDRILRDVQGHNAAMHPIGVPT